MRLKFILGFLASLLLMVGCSENMTNPEEAALMSDAQLIQAIQSAPDKQAISTAQLPTASHTVLSHYYSESVVELAEMAPKLGYELNLRRHKGTLIGEKSQTYFAMDGRELLLEGRNGGRDGGNREGHDGHNGRDRNECFDLVYPVTFLMADGSTITANSEAEADIAIREWFAANPGSRERPMLQYPVELIFKDGTTTVTINNEEEMRGALAHCGDRRGDDWGHNKCFDFVYPIIYTMPDGSTLTGNNREELGTTMREWYAAHPDVRERPALQFPVDIVFDDGTAETLTDDAGLRAAFAQCKDGRGDDWGHNKCFDFVYPISYSMPDGSTLTGNNREELGTTMREWYAAHPDVRERPALQFPVDIVFDDGTAETLTDDAGLRAAFAQCKDGRGDDWGHNKCFDFVYPISYSMPDGSTLTGNNREELGTAIREWYAAHPDVRERPALQFPVDIVFDDGTPETITDEVALRVVFARCHDGRGKGRSRGGR